MNAYVKRMYKASKSFTQHLMQVSGEALPPLDLNLPWGGSLSRIKKKDKTLDG